eukprot:324980-Pyramimonas_sp.AAC.1
MMTGASSIWQHAHIDFVAVRQQGVPRTVYRLGSSEACLEPSFGTPAARTMAEARHRSDQCNTVLFTSAALIMRIGLMSFAWVYWRRKRGKNGATCKPPARRVS